MCEGVRQQLEISVNSDYCIAFEEYSGYCCYILASGENCGFCNYSILITNDPPSTNLTGNCILDDKPQKETSDCESETSSEPGLGGVKCKNEPPSPSEETNTSSASISNSARDSSFAKFQGFAGLLHTTNCVTYFVDLFSTMSCTPTDFTILCTAFFVRISMHLVNFVMFHVIEVK